MQAAARTTLSNSHICAGTWLTPATSVPRQGSPLPHLHRDWARPCHISAGTRLATATSAPGLGSPLPHRHRDWAHPCHICAGTGARRCHICTGTGLTPATSAPGLGLTSGLDYALIDAALTTWQRCAARMCTRGRSVKGINKGTGDRN